MGVCIPACNGAAECVSQHAIGQGVCVHPYYGQQAGGMHPTGMLSYFDVHLIAPRVHWSI